MFLVDTNVLSLARTAPGSLTSRWLERNESRLFISVVTISEVMSGISKLRRKGAVRKAADIEGWFGALIDLYRERVLPLDRSAAEILGRLIDQARGAGNDPGLFDLAIAATAAGRGLTVVTRNTRHFMGLEIPVLNPFYDLPGA